MENEINFVALYVERDKLVNLLSSFKFFNYVMVKQPMSVDLSKNSADAREVFKRIRLRKDITELNKQVNDFLNRYAEAYRLPSMTKGEQIFRFREDLTKKFAYASLDQHGDWVTNVFFDKNSTLRGKFYDCLNSEDMKRFIEYLKFYIEATKTENYLETPVNATIRAYIETASTKKVLDYVPALPDKSEKYLEAKTRLTEIDKVLKAHNKPTDSKDDLQKGTTVDEKGQVHLF